MALHPGELAPDFTRAAQNSEQVRLVDYQGIIRHVFPA
jgi:peroxiredoxin